MKMRNVWLLLAACAPLSLASPAGSRSQKHALKPTSTPTIIELPYATYEAARYDEKADQYVFKNIRFAAPPTGTRRFAKPAAPESTAGIQKPGRGGTCPQFVPTKMVILATNGITGRMFYELSKVIDVGRVVAWLSGGGPINEDCLFLDVHVPGKAMRKEAKLPVVNWIYGGAFVTGNKEKQYNGTAIVHAAENDIIYVVGNYRLGAFGWLSGSAVEDDKTATANAGLYDQRAVLEWIQKYIDRFGGNPDDVTVMGESAGASSIMHHLTAYGGTQDPLFKRAIIQSPAFYPAVWDRNGADEKTFEQFLAAAGCKDQGMTCLRSKKVSVISKAQQGVINDVPDGSFGFGPSPDGQWVRQLPQLELLTGNFYKNISSLIISHMTNEADLFVTRDPKQTTDSNFVYLIDQHFNHNSNVSAALQARLPAAKFQSARDRMLRYANDAVFICNTRYLSEAYKGRTYNFVMQGNHGQDVFANFYSPSGMQHRMVNYTIGPENAVKYQKYIASMLRSGNPNTYRAPDTPEWPLASVGAEIYPTLQITNQTLAMVGDPANSAVECDIWAELFATVTDKAGYAPANGKLETHLGDIEFTIGEREPEISKGSAPPAVPDPEP